MVGKYVPYRNGRLLRHAKDQPCTGCGAEDGTIVAAHSNLGEDGKGIGKKSDDLYIAFLCFTCHNAYDRKLGFTQDDFHRAMKRTWKILVSDGVLK